MDNNDNKIYVRNNVVYPNFEQMNSLLAGWDLFCIHYKTNISGSKLEITLDYGSNYKYFKYLFNLYDDTINCDETNYGALWKSLIKEANVHDIAKDDELRKFYGYKEFERPSFENYKKTRVIWNIRDSGNYSYFDDLNKNKDFYHCYSYDANSAYNYAMVQPMPDTRVKPRLNSVVGENEFGVLFSGECTNTVGAFANYVFPLIESPYINWVNKRYNKKAVCEKGSKERQVAKDTLTKITGMMHRHNIIHRVAILFYAKRYISKFIDENTLYCNVDSIVSTVPRDDIPIGNELGQFKIEHSDEKFRFKSTGVYCWNDTEIHYQGINSEFIDSLDYDHINVKFKYKYNENTRRIEINE